MFIRGPQPESIIWQHFRRVTDGFAFGERHGLFEAQLVPNADRAVELFVALLEHLAPAVDVHMEDWRSGRAWFGEALAYGDVREAVGRSKQVLSSQAGAEITVTSGPEQLTLNANLELFAYATTDRWLYVLHGKGLQRVRSLRRRSWRLQRGEFSGAPSAELALQSIAERLGLDRVAAAPSP